MSRILKFLFLVVGFSLAVGIALIPSLQKIQEVEKNARVSFGDQVIVADVAKTEKEREQGLSGRKYMRTNEGMLFVFEEKGYHSFWMKGMEMPIDVVWISGNEVVGFEKHVLPHPQEQESELRVYEPPSPVDKFLEVRGGRVDLLDIKPGDTIKIRRIVPSGGSNNL